MYRIDPNFHYNVLHQKRYGWFVSLLSLSLSRNVYTKWCIISVESNAMPENQYLLFLLMKLSLMPTWTCSGPTGCHWCHHLAEDDEDPADDAEDPGDGLEPLKEMIWSFVGLIPLIRSWSPWRWAYDLFAFGHLSLVLDKSLEACGDLSWLWTKVEHTLRHWRW